jgi:hypothetical protein
MKNSFLLLLYILTTQTMYGQQNRADSLRNRDLSIRYHQKIDSLQKLLKIQPANDSNKVARLFLLSEAYFSDMRYADGLMMAANAKALSNQLNYAKGEALYLQAMSIFHTNSTLGFYYKHQADWLLDTKTTVDQAENIAAPNFELEIQKLKAAKPFIENNKDSLGTANIDLALMMKYLQLDKDSIAMLYAERPLRIFKKQNNVLPVFEILRLQMDYFEQKGNKPAAKERELQAIKAITSSSDKKTIALIAYVMGEEYYYRSHFGLAIEFLTKSDVALEELGDVKLRISVLRRIGLSYELSDVSEKAVEYYKKLIGLRKKSNDTVGVEYVYMHTHLPLQTFLF